MPPTGNYTIFQQFIDTYISQGFAGIRRHDPMILALEETMRERKQFCYIGDLIHIKILFTAGASEDMIGVDRDHLDTGSLYKATHPEDLHRMNLARLRLFRSGTELFNRKEGEIYYSIPFFVTNSSGQRSHLLFQGYLFYTLVPYETVFVLFVHTDISGFAIPRHVYHHYIGEDPAMFRYPDDDLLQSGPRFSDREFEILELLASGMESEKVADKLFLSVNTVNTHRRNILRKTNKSTTDEVILDLMEKGIM